MLVDYRSIEQDAVDFYDELSADYDAMTGFDKRFAAERPFFRLIVERHNIKSAIDAGRGPAFTHSCSRSLEWMSPPPMCHQRCFTSCKSMPAAFT